MKPTRLLRFVRRRYARRWAIEAEQHDELGHYRWLADQLAGCERVLEVGCGTGQATDELARRGHRVLSVEENPYCLRTAETRLARAGVPTRAVCRGRLERRAQRYAVRYAAVDLALDAQVCLIEGVLGADPSLASWLAAGPQFDAFVYWLPELQRAYPFHVRFGRPEHRATIRGGLPAILLELQHEVARLAELLLRPGGVLHVVERGSWEDLRLDRPTVRRPPRAAIGNASLFLERVAFEPWTYSPPTVEGELPFESAGYPTPKHPLVLRSAIWRQRAKASGL